MGLSLSGLSGLSGLVGASAGGEGVSSSDILHLWAAEPLVSGFSGPIIQGVRVDNSSHFDAASLDEFDDSIIGTSGLIDRLYDQKGSNHLICRDSGDRPGYSRTTIYGKDALDQSTDALARQGFASSIIGEFPITMYVVAQDIRGDNNNRNHCFLFATSSTDFAGFTAFQVTTLDVQLFYETGGVSVSPIATNPALFTMTISDSTNASVAVNGGTSDAGTINTLGSPVYFQFNRWNGWNPLGWCKFACIAISASRSTDIEDQIKAHYGIS